MQAESSGAATSESAGPQRDLARQPRSDRPVGRDERALTPSHSESLRVTRRRVSNPSEPDACATQGLVLSLPGPGPEGSESRPRSESEPGGPPCSPRARMPAAGRRSIRVFRACDPLFPPQLNPSAHQACGPREHHGAPSSTSSNPLRKAHGGAGRPPLRPASGHRGAALAGLAPAAGPLAISLRRQGINQVGDGGVGGGGVGGGGEIQVNIPAHRAELARVQLAGGGGSGCGCGRGGGRVLPRDDCGGARADRQRRPPPVT
jgi:hypothetical protein